MSKVFLLVIFLCLGLGWAQTSKITAELTLISYEPLRLNLTFSEPLPLPKFQLLLNEIRISCTVVSGSQLSSFYILEGSSENTNASSYET